MMVIPGEWLQIKLAHMEIMRSEVIRLMPEEACGLVAGIQGKSCAVFPVANILHNPTRFRLDPAGQLEVFSQMEQHGWELLAIFHSHPSGPEVPSQTDIDEAAYPEAAHLIWFQQESEWMCRAYRIYGNGYREIGLSVITPEKL